MLDVKKETVRKALYGVEVAVINSTDDLEEQLQSQGRSFQPYAFWRDGRIDTMQIAKTGNDYLEDDWYGRALATDSGYWSEPYIDDAGSGALIRVICNQRVRFPCLFLFTKIKA